MRPDQRDLDEEIRGHLAIGVQERIDRGEDPADARRAALAEFGSLMGTRDSMRDVWRNRRRDMMGSIGQDIRVTLRSLMRARSLTATVAACSSRLIATAALAPSAAATTTNCTSHEASPAT